MAASRSSVLSRPTLPVRRQGSETPRVWTPPLRKLTPKTSAGFECIDFAESVLGIRLFPWQKWTLIHALELLPDGHVPVPDGCAAGCPAERQVDADAGPHVVAHVHGRRAVGDRHGAGSGHSRGAVAVRRRHGRGDPRARGRGRAGVEGQRQEATAVGVGGAVQGSGGVPTGRPRAHR